MGAVPMRRMSQRITIEKRSTAVDDAGQQSTSWSDVRNCNADVWDRGGSQSRMGTQEIGIVDTVVIIHYPREDEFPTPEMRVKYDYFNRDRLLNIISVQQKDTRAKELWLYCKEEVA